ncbi:MAG: SLBB domain-containing protein [Caulobacteraceae bacterium]|nr:SLBB domain-containing protein [Caulobacteraceae bacterium]
MTSRKVTMTPTPKLARGLGLWAAVLAVCCVGFSLSGPALAQSAVYDPSYQGGGQSSNNTGAAATGQATTGSQSAGAAGAAIANGVGSVPQYSPTVISGGEAGPAAGVSGDMSAAGSANTPVTNPTSSGMIGQPLYVRPSETTPGQFQLYTRPPPQPGEFEKFVERALGHPLPRFGESLILNGGRGFVTPATTTVPPDYRLNPGDELVIGVTGSVQANLRLVINSEGMIFIPQIGNAKVAGLRYGDVQEAIARRFGEQYKQAHVSVVIGRLHGITVYVTGFAVSPGAYTVSSLSTLVDAVLAAGGPSSGGSFRTIELRRNGQLVTTLDMYDLLIRGDKSHDALLQNQDVINVTPVGPQLAVTGSVNDQAIYEARPGDTIADVIAYAGGLNSVADPSRLVVAGLEDMDRTGSREITLSDAKAAAVRGGDIIRVLSLAGIERPIERQAILATIDGEVDHPGRYYLPPGSTMADLLNRAGGLTGDAFVYGTDLNRQSVQRQQQASFDRVIADLQLQAAVSPMTALNHGTPEQGLPRQQAMMAVIDQLRARKPDGRLVLDTPYGSSQLPTNLRLEDNDTVHIPPVPTTVGVFGAVFEPGSFIFRAGDTVNSYVRRGGGPQRFGDRGEMFVVHSNGAVESAREVKHLGDQPVLPGDVIFVPVKTSLDPLQRIREIATVIYQLGLGVATIGILAAAAGG